MGCIYYARHRTTGKGYVGVDSRSDDGSRRWHGHTNGARKGGDGLFKRAIRKYGVENFVIDPVWESDDKEALFAKEGHFIRWFGTRAPAGYNMTDGGEGLLNPCAETRAKLSASSKRTYEDPVYRAKLPERCARQSASLKRTYEDPEVRAKTSVSTKRAMARPEVRANHKAAINHPEARAKRSASMKRAMADPEYRAKHMGDNHPMKRPENRAKMSVSLRAKYVNPTPSQLRRWRRRDEIRAGIYVPSPRGSALWRARQGACRSGPNHYTKRSTR